MEILSTPHDPFDGNQIIGRAVQALTLGGELDIAEIPRERAARLLSMWAHNHELTEHERAAVLARFPLAPGRGHAWWPHPDYNNERHVWRCTCGHRVDQMFGAPVPDELISHPQSFGQLRGEK